MIKFVNESQGKVIKGLWTDQPKPVDYCSESVSIQWYIVNRTVIITNFIILKLRVDGLSK